MTLSIAMTAMAMLLLPSISDAWGPATHMKLGLDVLESAVMLSPLVRELIRRHPYDFLYGNISADITIGKKFIEYRHHCHNWLVGFEVLRHARKDASKAFAYGYLAHLAADTVAHNDFIPGMMLKDSRMMQNRHLSLELRFDRMIEPDVWPYLGKIARLADGDSDLMMKDILENTLFSFGTNKRIFSGFLIFQRVASWRKLRDSNLRRRKLGIPTEEYRRYIRLSRGAMHDFLLRFDRAKCFQLDPAGISALESARRMKRILRMMKRENGRARGMGGLRGLLSRGL
jgi:hypothetical protein